MQTNVKLFLALAFSALLCGCGGGDAGPAISAGGTVAAPTPTPTADPSDKYIGRWKTACSGPATIVATGAVVSSYSTVTITKASATSYSVTSGNVAFSGAGCTGAGTPVAGESATNVFSLAGTKTIGSVTVDKVSAPNGSATIKNLAYLNATARTLQFGDTGASVDSDGYPNALAATVYTPL